MEGLLISEVFMEVFNVVMRILHVLSAVLLVGGLAFFLIGVSPAMRLLDDGLRGQIMTLARRSYYKVSHAAISLLLLTGAWNWYVNIEAYRAVSNKAMLQGILGFKALLGIAIAVILFGEAFGVIKGKGTGATKLIVALGVVVIILAAIVRHLRMGVVVAG